MGYTHEVRKIPRKGHWSSNKKSESLLLDNSDLWSKFYLVTNEMIITKIGLSPCRFRFKNGNWVSIGIDKRKHLEINNNLIKNGSHWMNFGVGFPKIKLTNRPSLSLSSKKHDKLRINNNDSKISHKNYKTNKYTTTTTTDNNNPTRSVLPEGHFCLTSFHKYQPRICMIKYSNHGDSNDEKYFTFEKATFIAVTHYQNETEQKVRQRKLNSCISLPSVKLYYSSTNNKNTTTKSLPSQTPPLLHSSPHPSSSYQQNQRQNSYFPQISNHSNQWNQEYYQLSTPVTPATSTTQNIPISTNDITDYCDFQYIRERYGTEAEKEADFVVADWN
ncbi:14202_t:CDS:2 [Entrophospora sp. SA101]|nr:14202_t:CDS:2 [Entrophospora sp. SA101]